MRTALVSGALALCLAVIPAGGSRAFAQAKGVLTPAGCLKFDWSGPVEVRGLLSVRVFPGPPNYESVAHGDAPERTYLMKLPKPICVDDGANGFADPSVKFDMVHVTVANDGLWSKLRAGLGKNVLVTGEGHPAFTGHHREPLVVIASEVVPQ